MYIDSDMIVVSIRAHQYKLALRRQVLRTGGIKGVVYCSKDCQVCVASHPACALSRQDESIHALHAKARARMLVLAQCCETFRLLLSRVCMCALPLARSLTHSAPLPHSTNQIIRTSDTRNMRPCTLSTHLYIVNPEPESLKPKDYARIR